MGNRFAGKTALVTGAGGGIGKAVAMAFAREGAKLALVDKVPENLQATTRAIRDLGNEVVSADVDIADSAQVEAFVDRVVAELGTLDCAVNNAGVRPKALPLAEVSEEDFDRVMSVNTRGVWVCMKHEINAMLAQGGGAIVNIASTAAIIAVPNQSSYIASKHAVVGLTKAGALEYGKRNVRINCVCPGYTRTPMAIAAIADKPGVTVEVIAKASPLGRIGEPDEQARVVLFLCSDDASYMLGQPVVVDGGYTII